MREVSGVTGAGPILHAVFDYLHANRGTSWYRTPAGMVERNVHPLTGKLLADADPRGVREKFLPGQLPALESLADYDGAGNVQLGPEYADWFNSAENGISDRAILASTNGELRIISPLPGSVYVVDPDVPSTRRIPLAANGGTQMRWESESLVCRAEPGADFALATDGEHRIVVTDLVSGRQAETWIRIRSL